MHETRGPGAAAVMLFKSSPGWVAALERTIRLVTRQGS